MGTRHQFFFDKPPTRLSRRSAFYQENLFKAQLDKVKLSL
jgi:hypothetical protein